MALTIGPHHHLLTSKLAIDCEFMPFNKGQLLGRVSLLDVDGEIGYDTFVHYPLPILVAKTD
jgi:hypothetical protein